MEEEKKLVDPFAEESQEERSEKKKAWDALFVTDADFVEEVLELYSIDKTPNPRKMRWIHLMTTETAFCEAVLMFSRICGENRRDQTKLMRLFINMIEK